PAHAQGPGHPDRDQAPGRDRGRHQDRPVAGRPSAGRARDPGEHLHGRLSLPAARPESWEAAKQASGWGSGGAERGRCGGRERSPAHRAARDRGAVEAHGALLVYDPLEGDGPPGELGAVEVHIGAGEPGVPEAHIGARELCPREPDIPASELGADEAEGSTDEPGRRERHMATGARRTGEVRDVEHGALEAEVVPTPGHGAAGPEMVADDPDGGAPDLTVAFPMLRRVSWVVRQAQ